MFTRRTVFCPALLLVVGPAIACSFGGDSGPPDPLGLGEQPQAEGGAAPLDEPLEPFGDDEGDSAEDSADDAGQDSADDAPQDTADDSSDDPADDGPDDSADDSSDHGGEDTADDSGDDSAPPPVDCDTPFAEIIWAEDAALTLPMSLITASSAIGDPEMARSVVAEEGTITFELSLPCAGEYYVHGLVWDLVPGAWLNPDADSFFVDLGGGDEFVWRYGCQTLGMTRALSWQSLAALQAQPCNITGVSVVAPEPGDYTITLRNREAGSQSAVAAIGALSVSNQSNYDPYDDYDPYD